MISNIDPKILWSYMSSYYQLLDLSQKEDIEIYWQKLLNGLEGLYYNLGEAKFSNLLPMSVGYVQESYLDITINKNDVIFYEAPIIELLANQNNTVEDITMEYYICGVQKYANNVYTTTCTRKVISIASNDIVTIKFNPKDQEVFFIFKREIGSKYFKKLEVLLSETTTEGESLVFIDNNSHTWVSVDSIPTVSSAIRYYAFTTKKLKNVVELSKIKNLVSNKEYNTYLKNSNSFYIEIDPWEIDSNQLVLINAIRIPDIINNLFVKYFNISSVNTILDNNLYATYISSSSANESPASLYAKHLTSLVHAIFLDFKKGLSLSRLKHIMNLYFNVPFTLEDGTITSIADNLITITGIHEYTYTIPNTLTISVKIGDNVKAYDCLTDGVMLTDYIENPELCNSFLSNKYSSILCHIPTRVYELSNYKEYLNNDLLQNIKQPGISIVYLDSEELPIQKLTSINFDEITEDNLFVLFKKYRNYLNTDYTINSSLLKLTSKNKEDLIIELNNSLITKSSTIDLDLVIESDSGNQYSLMGVSLSNIMYLCGFYLLNNVKYLGVFSYQNNQLTELDSIVYNWETSTNYTLSLLLEDTGIKIQCDDHTGSTVTDLISIANLSLPDSGKFVLFNKFSTSGEVHYGSINIETNIKEF